MTTIEESVLSYLRSIGQKDLEITHDTLLDDDLAMDSLDVIEMSLHLEEDLSIHIEDDDDDIRNSKTVGDLIQLITRKYGTR